MKYIVPAITSVFALTAAQTNGPSKEQMEQCIPLSQSCSPALCKPCGLTYGFYGEFLYLQPNYTDLYYGATAVGVNPASSVPAEVASPYWTVLEIQPDYHPGFEVGASVLINKENLKIEAKWERLHGEDSTSFEMPNVNGQMAGPFFDIGPNSAAYKKASGKLTTHFDEVSLVFAKQLCFFGNFCTSFYGGANFIRLEQILNETYSNASGSISRNVNTNSTFTGAGPEIGLDYDYRIYKGFFFSGSSVLSLCMGQMTNTTTYQSFTPELTVIGVGQPNNQAVTIPNRVQLIPSFEQRLGFSWSAVWNSFSSMLEIGYQCQIYLDAAQAFNQASQAVPPDSITDPTVGVFAVAFDQTNSNFMLTGPYARLGFEF